MAVLAMIPPNLTTSLVRTDRAVSHRTPFAG
jgi:hypothetical protein